MRETEVLRIGTARAVLIEGVGKDREEHIRRANEQLAAATGLTDLVIGRRQSGRPRLAPPYYELGISMAYRNGVLLAGFAPDRAVGVDVEPDDAKAVPDPAALARDHFAGAEAAAVAALEPEQARALFLRLWVAKEAALKVTGRGIADGLELPDCSGHIELLLRDGSVFEAAMCNGWPAVQIAVKRVASTVAGALYCALAVEKCDPAC